MQISSSPLSGFTDGTIMARLHMSLKQRIYGFLLLFIYFFSKMVKSEVLGRTSVSQVILKKSYIDLSLLCLLRLVDIAKSLKNVRLFKCAGIFSFQ